LGHCGSIFFRKLVPPKLVYKIHGLWYLPLTIAIHLDMTQLSILSYPFGVPACNISYQLGCISQTTSHPWNSKNHLPFLLDHDGIYHSIIVILTIIILTIEMDHWIYTIVINQPYWCWNHLMGISGPTIECRRPVIAKSLRREIYVLLGRDSWHGGQNL
jgi:hypothetical protein